MRTASASEENDFILSSLSPSLSQKRLALVVVLVLLAVYLITSGPLSAIRLPRIDAFIPAYAGAMFVNDSVTAVVLFAQFSILRSRALLAIASGYVFTALILVPWTLTFPGVFASAGLLGAGLQSTAWLYILWHAGFPAFVIGYALLKDDGPTPRRWQGSVQAAIISGIGVTACIVCAATYLIIAADERLPPLMLDTVRLSALWPYAAGFAAALNAVAGYVLWARRRSVLDLWLMVVMCAYLIEICLISFPTPARFSVGWYFGRIFGLVAGSVVLFVLLYEITTLYGRLLQAVLAQRREREARLMTGETVSASIAHEIKQPLSGMVTNANAGLLWLDRATPDLDEAKAAFKHIISDGHRASAVIEGIRASFKKGARSKTLLDINELISETIAQVRGELQKHRILVKAAPNKPLPPVSAVPVQVQQVLLNLVTNAIESMALKRGVRVLRVRSEAHESGGVRVSVEDNGVGIQPQNLDRIFSPRFTTKSHGMGMGLSICRSIVEAHGGQLWAVPNEPEGAIFHLTLPAR